MTPLVMELLPAGLLFPQSTMHSGAVKILATFVALNTLMYATLAVVKMLPKTNIRSWFARTNRRAQDRSIYPNPETPNLDRVPRPRDGDRPPASMHRMTRSDERPGTSASGRLAPSSNAGDPTHGSEQHRNHNSHRGTDHVR
jgi:hypothetical protein